MSRTIRFQFDEHMPKAVARGLRRRGIDVKTTDEANLMGSSDEEQLLAANADGRVMVTQDTDFLILHQSGWLHSGIVFARDGSQSIGQWIESLSLIHGACDADEMINRVEFVSPATG